MDVSVFVFFFFCLGPGYFRLWVAHVHTNVVFKCLVFPLGLWRLRTNTWTFLRFILFPRLSSDVCSCSTSLSSTNQSQVGTGTTQILKELRCQTHSKHSSIGHKFEMWVELFTVQSERTMFPTIFLSPVSNSYLSMMACWCSIFILNTGVEPASCYWRVTGSIPLVCMSKCPRARYWAPNHSKSLWTKASAKCKDEDFILL